MCKPLKLATIANWAPWYGLTLIIELLFVLLGFRSVSSLSKRCVAGVLANLATHPIAWIFIECITPSFAALCGAEVFAVAVEFLFFLWLLRVSALQSLGVAFIANGSSYLAGVAVLYFRG